MHKQTDKIYRSLKKEIGKMEEEIWSLSSFKTDIYNQSQQIKQKTNKRILPLLLTIAMAIAMAIVLIFTFAFFYSFFTSWPLLHFCLFLFEDLLACASRQRLQIRTKWTFVLIFTFAFVFILIWRLKIRTKWTFALLPAAQKQGHAFIRASQKRGKQMFACK